MAKKFFIELNCDTDAESIRNMITDVLNESLVKSVVAVGDEAVEQGVHPTGLWVCPDCNMMHGENRITCVGCGKPRG